MEPADHRRRAFPQAPLERALRAGDPPIVGRVHDGRLLLDLRTVLPEQDAVVAERLAAALADV